MKTASAVVAAVLAIVGNVPYLWDVWKRKTTPHVYTWFVWSIVSCVVFFGQLEKGAGIGALPTAASEIFTILIFLFSLKYGYKHPAKSDIVFLVLALLGLIPWIVTKDPTITVIIVVGMDLTASVPTLRKTWHYPKAETPILYVSNVVRHILALFSLRTYNIATALHPCAMIVLNTVMTALIFVRTDRRPAAAEPSSNG